MALSSIPSASGPVRAPARTGLFARARRRVAVDRAAGLAIRVGGIAVIFGVAGIFAFLVFEIAPVLRPARVTLAESATVAGVAPAALLLDEYRTNDAALGADGTVRVVRLSDGATIRQQTLAPAFAAVAVDPEHSVLAGISADGVVQAAPVTFKISFDGQKRVVAPELGDLVRIELLSAPAPGAASPVIAGPLALRLDAGATTAAVALADGGIALALRRVESNAFSGESTETVERRILATPTHVTALAIDARQRDLFAGTTDGQVLRFDLRGGDAPPEIFSAGSAGISALTLLIGGRTLVVGQRDGSLSSWFAVPQPSGGARRFTRIRDWERYPGSIARLAPSQRDRSFFAASQDGTLGLQHSTSGRTLWREASPIGAASALAFAPKGDGAALAGSGKLASLTVVSPHPELSLASLFGKVWYKTPIARPTYGSRRAETTRSSRSSRWCRCWSAR